MCKRGQSPIALSKEVLESLLNFSYWNEADAQLAVLQAVHVILGYDNALKTQLCGLSYALLYAAYGADFARKAYLTGHADGAVNCYVKTVG